MNVTVLHFKMAAILWLLVYSTSPVAADDTAQVVEGAPDENCQPTAAYCDSDTHKRDVYRWTDENGNVFYGDSIPDRYSDQLQVHLQDNCFQEEKRKNPEAAERLTQQERAAEELQTRTDEALLKAYFQAPYPEPAPDGRPADLCSARINEAELYLEILYWRLDGLEAIASESGSSDCLLRDMRVTKEKIQKHEDSLRQYRDDIDGCREDPRRYQDAPMRQQDGEVRERLCSSGCSLRSFSPP